MIESRADDETENDSRRLDVSELKKYERFLQDERNAAYLYQALSRAEKDERLAAVYAKLSETELRHAADWSARIAAAGGEPVRFKPSLRTRLLAFAAGKFGTGSVVGSLVSMEDSGAGAYAQAGAPGSMVREETSHSRILKQLAQTSGGGVAGGTLAAAEGRHKAAGGNALRAAVLGANDGLVSVFSLVMGVAGAGMSGSNILVTGLAGLLAGAISMALGEWLSVQSSRELYSKQIEVEEEEIREHPEDEVEELSLIYQARGVEASKAEEMARKIMTDPTAAIDVLAREELGIDPDELGGSAWEAAFTSFGMFAVGAIIPVAPFIFLEGLGGILASMAAAALGLFLVGAATSLFTGRSAFFAGFRMVAVGAAAAGVTYGIGGLIGVNLG